MKQFTQEYFNSPGTVTRKIYRDIVKDVLSIATQKLNKPVRELVVLDVGSSYGYTSFELAKRVKKVVGIEPYQKVYNIAIEKNKYTNVEFYNKMIEDFKSPVKFDLVFSLTTLEHMPNANVSFKRIFELLKVNGLVYITVPNKLWPIEVHYKLPFLTYLPLPLASLYLRMMGKGKSFEDASYAKTYFEVKKFLNQFPCSYEFIVPDPQASYLGCGATQGTWEEKIRNFGIRLLKYFPFMWTFSKGFIILAQKTAKKNKL